MTIARIALDVPLPRLFDYLAPGLSPADVGRRVWVPFGKRQQVGVVVDLAASSELPAEQLRAVAAVDRDLPALPGDLLALARFAADYYQYPYGAALLSLLPPALKRRQACRPAEPAAYALTPAGREHAARLTPRAPAQRRLAALLQAGPVAAAALAGLRPTLRDWLRRGLAAPAALAGAVSRGDAPPALNAEQAAAVAAILEGGEQYAPWLLFGITGSGKTEVYLRLIEAVLARGRQVLVLAPEIHLTPQLTERFRHRFPAAHLVSLHSGLADGERAAHWLDCLTGRADIVLGTRLAVFAPLPRLGLLVVDEEHDASYKQMEGLRYSARDVAVWRARQRGVPVVLGSATPSLESWANAQRGRYRRLDLPVRAGIAALPEVRLIDSRTDRPRLGLTAGLVSALEDNLRQGEQSLVFINRRGYAPTLLCNACGHVAGCPRCAAHLVLHRSGARSGGYRLQCHHCGLAARPAEACPECGSLDLRPSGQGTQRVEETLAERFPAARILRVDRDTMSRKGRFAEVREAVRREEVDILVGTQILAKGHDFPQLTLVGVVGADHALMSADFRAGERLFAQLMQVAGRAGRGRQPGKVLVQTAFPRHPLYQALARHDYPAYAALSLGERRGAEFPPYARQALLRADAPAAEAAQGFLESARALALPLAEEVAVFDPTPALLSRVAKRERWQLLVQSRSQKHLQAFLKPWRAALQGVPAKAVNWTLDVDPMDF